MTIKGDLPVSRCQHRYHVYGLNVGSALDIPELAPARSSAVDAVIELGEVAESLDQAIGRNDWIEFSETSCLFKVPGVGRFLIENGDTIRIERRVDRRRQRGHGVPVTDVRVYLLGSAFGALLHQRGWTPFHVSALECNSGIWAFTGDSGAGKSTLAGFLHREYGWPLLSDDVSVLRPDDPEPRLHPGPRKLKLWPDAVEHLDYHGAHLRQDLSNTEKFQVYLADQQIHAPGTLRAMVTLERCRDDEPAVFEQLRGIEALAGAIYRPQMGRWFRQPQELIRQLEWLAGRIEVYRFRRRWSLDSLDRELQPLIEMMNAPRKAYGT